jgi:hypothetical protein
MGDINDIQAEIKAVKVALDSFADYEVEQDRIVFLKQQFTAVPKLKTYFGYSQEKLQDMLLKLQDEKNLLLAQSKGKKTIHLCDCFVLFVVCLGSNAILSELKAIKEEMKAGQAEMKAGQAEIQAEMKAGQAELKAKQESMEKKIDSHPVIEQNLNPSEACKSEYASTFLNLMSAVGFRVTTELIKLVTDCLCNETDLIGLDSQNHANYKFVWGNQDEKDSYLPLKEKLESLGFVTAIVSNGNNISHKNLISVTIAHRRKNLYVENGEIRATKGEYVIDSFNLIGNTDLVRLKKHADRQFISRRDVMYAIEVKTVLAMDTESKVNCCLREALLQLIGLNANNVDTSPSVILTNLNGKHFVLYIDWPTIQQVDDAEVQYELKIHSFSKVFTAIMFAEKLATRSCGTAEFVRRGSPHLTPRTVSQKKIDNNDEDLLVATGGMTLTPVNDDEDNEEGYKYGHK